MKFVHARLPALSAAADHRAVVPADSPPAGFGVASSATFECADRLRAGAFAQSRVWLRLRGLCHQRAGENREDGIRS